MATTKIERFGPRPLETRRLIRRRPLQSGPFLFSFAIHAAFISLCCCSDSSVPKRSPTFGGGPAGVVGAGAGAGGALIGEENAAPVVQEEPFVEYQPGSARIILSVPHGGLLDPADIPDRLPGCPVDNANANANANDDALCSFSHDASCANKTVCKITTVSDGYTIDLAAIVAQGIEEMLGQRPHVVVSNLKRTKLDPNREINEAAQNHPLAVNAYNEYHGFIEEAKMTVGRGILFDLHGQNHRQNSSELGYLLSKDVLNDSIYNTSLSSVRTLAEETGLDGQELLAGPESFGAFVEKHGFRAFPSPRQPFPGSDKYFSGGYITHTHGSLRGGLVDAIQVETPKETRMDGGETLRADFGRALARAMVEFYQVYYENQN